MLLLTGKTLSETQCDKSGCSHIGLGMSRYLISLFPGLHDQSQINIISCDKRPGNEAFLDSWYFCLLYCLTLSSPPTLSDGLLQLFEEECASDKEQAVLNFHEPSDLWKLPNTELYNRIA